MSEVTLETEVQYLTGVGPRWAEVLRRLDVRTVRDLLFHLPKDILDFSDVREPCDLEADELQSVRGTVVDVEAKRLRNGRNIVAALIDSGTGFARGVWFNQPWMRQRLLLGQHVLFSGKPKFKQSRWEFGHPSVQWLDDEDEDFDRLVLTRYRLTEGLKVHQLRRLIGNAIDACASQLADPIPESLRARLKLPSLQEAIRGVHQPESGDGYLACRRRILFDDLFEFQLGLALRRRLWRSRLNAPKIEVTAKIDSRIRRLFSFDFTDGQDAALKEIRSDLGAGFAMHRLLQADVGAGKTVIAIHAMLSTIAHGYQAVLMAPTELLATQHWQTIDSVLSESRVERALLTGSLGAAERRRVLAGMEDGTIQLIVGTQAVIQESVKFNKLGLVVIDEQHKFGVVQRASFASDESAPPPHILVMTATPIPRTLCLTQFGDLDITIMKELPQGRQPVVTSRLTNAPQKKKAWEFIQEQLRSKRQLYVVCPLVESSSEAMAGVASAEQTYEKMANGALKEFRVGLVHGRIDRQQRNDTMEEFRNGDLDVLVATTVIEVGVDVANATLMLILDAERFGLSQLHQLRGRVGRGRHRGFCFLVSDSESPEAVARLSAMERSSDGFELAEEDFELRGPGDILGTRQHGALPLRFADFLKDEAILKEARDEAFTLVSSGEFDEPEFAALKRLVLDRFSQLMDLPQSG